MSIEDVERIMDETREGIEYQRVGDVDINWKNMSYSLVNHSLNFITVSYNTGIIHSFFHSLGN